MTFSDCTADLVGQLNGNGQKGMLQIDAPMSKISDYATESTAGTQSADAAVLFDGSAPTSDWVTRMSTTESLQSSVFRRRSSRAR